MDLLFITVEVDYLFFRIEIEEFQSAARVPYLVYTIPATKRRVKFLLLSRTFLFFSIDPDCLVEKELD